MEPKIRFKGFEGEWKALSLDDCVNFLDSKRKPIEEGNRTKGIFPYYGASGIVDYINDYIFDEELILLSEDGANITDRNYPVCFLAKGKYWVNNHAHVLKAKEGFINSFLCNAMERKDYTLYNTGMAMPKLNKEACKRIPVLHPSSNEQQAIATYFTTLDSQISASTSRLTSLKQMKAASLQAMFPQKGETVPKIRFKGFEGEWRTCPLYHFAKKRTEKNTKMLYNITLTNSAEFGIIDQRNFFDHEISNSENINGYYVVRDHDFVYNPRISSSAPVGPINQNKLGYTGVMSPLYLVFEINGINRDFLEIFFHTTLWHKYMFDNGNTGARFDRLAISDEDFMKMPIPDIDFEEQQAIASYFTSLDRQISLQSQRLEKLKQIKSACLDKMFV